MKVQILGLLSRFLWKVGLLLLGLAGFSQTSEIQEEMKVHARKRQEVQQAVPSTIQVLESEVLESRGVETLYDLKMAVPNLWVFSTSGGGNQPMFLRGVGQWDFLSTTDPGVGVYVDEVYMGRTYSGFTDFLDLERIEVHKGPGGTLFGKNTIGGALQLWTKGPAAEPNTIVRTTIGNHEARGLKVETDIPLIPGTLLSRVSAAYEYNDGWLNRENKEKNLGQFEKTGIRFQLAWLPNDKWNHRLKLEGFKKRGTSQPHSQAGFVPNPLSDAFSFFVEPCCEIPISENQISYSEQEALDHQDVLFGTLISELIGEKGILKNILAYGDTRVHFSIDVDGSSPVYAETSNVDHQYQFSEELQWISSGLVWKWVSGFHFFREGASDLADVRLATGLFEASQGQVPIFDIAISNQTKAESFSLFGHVEIPLNDAFSLSLGARHVWETKSYDFSHIFLPIEQILVDGREEKRFDAFTPNIDLKYEMNLNQMWFVKAGKGFKSGGFNGRPLTPGNVQPFRPESLWSYELGSKTRFNSGFLYGAWFYSTYKDQQITGVTADESGALLIVVENAEKSTIHGLELEAQNTWESGWSSGIQLGTMNQSYDTFLTFDGKDLSHLNASFTPDWNGSFQIAKAHFIWGGRFKTTLSFNYKDDMELEIFNSRFLRQPGFSTVNLGLNFSKGEWDFTLTGKNLTDEDIKIGGTTSEASLGVAGVLWDAPLTVFFKGSYTLPGGR